jgi:hypothetical protein
MSEPLVSPGLQAVQLALEAGQTEVLAAFWHAIAQQGTPLVEPIADDATHMLVTFLWRVQPTVQAVYVFGPMTGFDLAHQLMSRLRDTPAAQRFGNVLTQSGGFGWAPEDDDEPEWFARHVATQQRVPVRFSLDVGILEHEPKEAPILASNRHLRNVLWAKGYHVDYAEVGGGHEGLSWQTAFADGLLALLGAHNGTQSGAGQQRPA